MTSILSKALNYVVDVTIQTPVLCIKNLILLLRRWKSTAVILLSPVAIVFLLWLLALLIEVSLTSYVQTGPRELKTQVDNYSKCVGFGGKSCYTIVYATNNNTVGTEVMAQIMSDYNLEGNARRFDTDAEMLDWMFTNPNQTLTAVSFSNTTSTAPNYPASRNITNVAYTLYYNTTSGNSATISGRGDTVNQVLDWQSIIDNTIIYIRGKTLGLNIPRRVVKQVYVKGFPRVPNRPNGQLSILTTTGPQFFSLSAMIILVICMYSIVLEKEQKLRFGMQMMGLRNVAYWVSWFITFAVVALIQVLITIAAGAAFQLFIFLQVDFFAVFISFMAFSVCMICLAFLLSTCLKVGKGALIFGFVLLAFSYILNLVVANPFIASVLYTESIPAVLPALLHLYPPYNFAMIFGDFMNKTQPSFDALTRTFVYKERYHIEDFSAWRGVDGRIPPSILAFFLLIIEGIVYLVLGWYLDNIIDSGAGTSRNPIFCILPSYWGCNCLNTTEKIGASSYPLYESELNARDTDVQKEYHMARDPNLKPAIRITGLQKLYYTQCWLSTVHAVRGLDLTVDEGTCLALLGHNGAGKTTTISIMQGFIPPSRGDVQIFGMSVKNSIDEIRKILGVCPQHDILWPDLTAREHLLLFSIFKRIPVSAIIQEVNDRLKDVSLFDVGNNLAGSFSGGMKRRLSVAIACIANPKIILLDEPTTGMDPVNKKAVWDLIARMKKNRVIVLTTHSMEEADALADRLGIMGYGQLQCIGNSLHLKHKFGTGYNINVVAKPGRAKEVRKLVTENVKSATRISSNAGNMIYGIPQASVQELSGLLEIMESKNDKPDTPFKEWSVSHTTLEEVYLQVTKHSSYAFEKIPNEQDDDDAEEAQAMHETQPEVTVVQQQAPTLLDNIPQQAQVEMPNITAPVQPQPIVAPIIDVPVYDTSVPPTNQN